MIEQRYLFILPWRAGMGALIRNTLLGFLYAEISRRTPVVLWRKNCLYFNSLLDTRAERGLPHSAFDDFFESENPELIRGLFASGSINVHSLFPPHWDLEKIVAQDPGYLKSNTDENDLDFKAYARSNPVAVFNGYKEINEISGRIPEGSGYHGLKSSELFYRLSEKYLQPKDAITGPIQHLWGDNAPTGPVLGVHYRGTDKFTESPRPSAKDYIKAISRWLGRHPSGKVFIATDCGQAYGAFRQAFRARMLSFDHKRSHDDQPVHFAESGQDTLGKEILRDCYALARCDATLMNNASNVALFVNEGLTHPERTVTRLSVSPPIRSIIEFKLYQFRKGAASFYRNLKGA